MKRISLFLSALFLLSACGNQTSSEKNTTSEPVTKSDLQKKVEHFMNTKSDLLHECENLYAVYKDDKFRIYMSSWDDTPIDTIFKSDVYKLMIERQESKLDTEYDGALLQRMEEEAIRRQKEAEKVNSSYFDSLFDANELETIKRQRQHERDSIIGIINRIKNQQDWNEPYWLIFEFVEDVDRTFAISGETDKAQYPCYCIYIPSTDELVTVVEKTKYSKPHVLKLLNKAL